MKTLLIRPFIDSTLGIMPPTALMYLSANVKKHHLAVRIIDNIVDRHVMPLNTLNPDNKHIEHLIKEIEAYNPDIIGMTLFSKELDYIKQFCVIYKTYFPRTTIVLGGPHPTACPEQTLHDITECDIVVRGEGEEILVNLINSLDSGGALSEIKGISYRNHDGRIISNLGSEIPDINTLPPPDREELLHHYRANVYSGLLYGKPVDFLMTSRGCPFQCNFCFKVCTKYRSMSPERVINEIEWIVQNINPKAIVVMDDSFTVEKQRCHSILDAIILKKLPCKFYIRSRVDAIDKELLLKMKKARVESIVFGLESGSQKMLNAINKKTTVEMNEQACKLTKSVGIQCHADIMLFYPGETHETLRETEEFLRRTQPTGVKIYLFTPLPETIAYQQVKQQGTLVGDWGVGKDSPWVKLENFENLEAMEKIASRMLLRYYANPLRAYAVVKNYYKALLLNINKFAVLLYYGFTKSRKY